MQARGALPPGDCTTPLQLYSHVVRVCVCVTLQTTGLTFWTALPLPCTGPCE